MKSIKKIILISILYISGFYSYAQTTSDLYPDELVLKTDSQIEVKFRFYRMRDKEVYLKDDLWKSILNTMNTAVESTVNDGGIKVIYSKISGSETRLAKIEVKDIENNSDIFLIDSEGMTEIRSGRIEFHILLHKVAITFSLNDLDDLDAIKELSVESVWDQIAQKYENAGKQNLYKGDGVFKYGKANISEISSKPGGDDTIELSSGVGLGFYRDRFVPDLGFKVSFNFPDRFGNPKLQFGMLYTQHFFFQEGAEGDFDLDLNAFLSGFVSHQFLPNYELGLAFGTLIHRNGNFYEGNTYKVSFYTNKDNSKFSLTPELIFTNDFKDAFPAVRFGLSF